MKIEINEQVIAYASINPNKSRGKKKEKCCGQFKIEKVNFTLLKMKEPSAELKSQQRNESITRKGFFTQLL